MGNDYFSGGANPKTSAHHEQESILNASAPVSKARERNGNIVSWTVQHHAELLSAILMVFAIFVVFVSEFDITNASWARAISAETLILATCSYIVYLNSYTIGTNTATRIEFTKKVEDAYLAEVKKIRDKRIEWMLELFCSDYKTGELKKTRTEILLCAGFSEADTALILEGKDIDESALTEEQAKALKKAKSLKPIKLNKAMLVNSINGHSERSPIRSEGVIKAHKYVSFATKLIFVIISCIVVVSLTIKLTSDFSLVTIIYALFQIMLLLLSLFGGMALGYTIKIKYTERLQDIIGVLYEFWEWFDFREKQPNISEKAL